MSDARTAKDALYAHLFDDIDRQIERLEAVQAGLPAAITEITNAADNARLLIAALQEAAKKQVIDSAKSAAGVQAEALQQFAESQMGKLTKAASDAVIDAINNSVSKPINDELKKISGATTKLENRLEEVNRTSLTVRWNVAMITICAFVLGASLAGFAVIHFLKP